jgi:hypothetical protein
MINSLKVLAVLAGGLFASTSANAVVLPDSGFPLGTNASYTTAFNSSAGNAAFSFDLLGYRTLDGGGNGYTDVFHLSLNGTEIFSGTFNLGGGGTNDYNTVGYTNSVGAVVTNLNNNPVFNPFVPGGSITIAGLLTLVSGVNTLQFTYGPLQDLGDEGWGVKNLNVSSVPVPPAALLLGTGLLGLAGLRRKAKKA